MAGSLVSRRPGPIVSRSSGSSGGSDPTAALAAACSALAVAGSRRSPAHRQASSGAAPWTSRRARPWRARPGMAGGAGRLRRTDASRPHRDRDLRQRQDRHLRLAFAWVEWSLDRMDAADRMTRSSASNVSGWKVVAPSQRTLPTPCSRSIHSGCSRQATRLWTWSRSMRPAYQPSCRGNVPSVGDRAVQTFVATNASRRRPPSAAERTASARPYIGELSTTVAPASSVVATTASAVGWRRAAGRTPARRRGRRPGGRCRSVRTVARPRRHPGGAASRQSSSGRAGSSSCGGKSEDACDADVTDSAPGRRLVDAGGTPVGGPWSFAPAPARDRPHAHGGTPCSRPDAAQEQ